MILSCNNVSKAFGTDIILSNISFHIEDYEKAAIVGINGAGKSTLMKIIAGEEEADSGLVTLAHGKALGYLAQQDVMNTDNTIVDELLSIKADVLNAEQAMRTLELSMKNAQGSELEKLLSDYSRLTERFERLNGYAYKSEITGVLKGLGFDEEDFSKNIQTLSGGQKTRVALGKLLLTKPDIILLDEPTNHLDLESIRWLETFLLNYSGSVLLVAHDRYFLDRIVTKIIELDNGKVTVYLGNYSDYSAKHTVLRNMQMQEYMKQQQDIKHQEEVITKLKQFNREKSIRRAESREKMLERIERIDKPAELNDKMKLSLEPAIESGTDVLDVTGLSKGFDGITLFDDISFSVKRGEHVALIGSNGTGKTTILKLINGISEPDSGVIRIGTKVHIGYYDQEHHLLNPENTLFEEISEAYPELTNTKIRNTLAAFLFTDDDVFKKIDDLSGGEKARVSLAKLMLSSANFLILDEPTNHLDMVSKEILENAVNSYTGTVFYVSHDRYFINRTASRILELTQNTLLNYIGNYDYYEEKREAVHALGIKKNPDAATTDTHASSSKAEWRASREDQNAKRRIERNLAKAEKRIEELEMQISAIDEQTASPENVCNPGYLLELHNRRTELEQELDGQYAIWEKLSEEET